jgi:hypothetical protein
MTTRIDTPVDTLVSYHYFRRDEVMRALTGTKKLRLIADSGAFSAFSQGAEIALDEYAQWCRTWSDHLCWTASLDVFGNPRASYANWRTLLDEHGLRTVPTIHIGTDPTWLDTYADAGVDFVGLGGMVGRGTGVIRWVVHVLRYARDRHPAMRFHGWGVTAPTMLDRVPLYSADSSGLVNQACRFGSLRLYDPRTRTHRTFRLDGRTPHQHRRLLSEVYGVSAAQVATSHASNRAQIIQLCAAATQLYAADLQRRHRVTAPSWGINHAAPSMPGDALTGPRVHMVSAQPKDFPRLLGLDPHQLLPTPTRRTAQR